MAKLYSDEDTKNVLDFIRSRNGSIALGAVVIVSVVAVIFSLFTGGA